MVSLDIVQHILELAVFSGHVAGEQPVSVLITAPAEAGKTEMVASYRALPVICKFCRGCLKPQAQKATVFLADRVLVLTSQARSREFESRRPLQLSANRILLSLPHRQADRIPVPSRVFGRGRRATQG